MGLLKQVQQLVDRLNSTTEEMEALQESFQRTLGSKEQELRTANELMREQHQIFQEAQADLEHKLGRVSQMIEAARFVNRVSVNNTQSPGPHLKPASLGPPYASPPLHASMAWWPEVWRNVRVSSVSSPLTEVYRGVSSPLTEV